MIDSRMLGFRFTEAKSKSGVQLLSQQNFRPSLQRIKSKQMLCGSYRYTTIHSRPYKASVMLCTLLTVMLSNAQLGIEYKTC
jgi:hypothetical protein